MSVSVTRQHEDLVVALAELHALRSQTELECCVGALLARIVPGADLALVIADEIADSFDVRIVVGEANPLRGRRRGAFTAWHHQETPRLPVRFRDHRLGELWLGRRPDPDEGARLEQLLAHYATALVGLTLQAESRQATEDYCASLQALEEGIVLFQESDPETVTARLLGLATSMVHATAGALYVLHEVGRVDSGLRLEQALGMPESLLATFRGADGCAWPEVLLDQQAQIVERSDAAAGGREQPMAMLDPACVPAMLHKVVVLPLRYHGVQAGVCLLFNPVLDASRPGDVLGRLQSFAQLAAALLHRLSLEALTATSVSIARELEIAETIQKRLVPDAAPPTDEYEFAWSTIAAKNIGGDYVDVISSDLGDIYVVIADASGHGINSALLMTSFRANYRGNAPWNEPGDAARMLNGEVVREVGPTGMFITATMLRLERETRRLSMSSAGHNPTLIYRAATGALEAFDSDGPPMGFVAGVEFSGRATTLASGDVVLLYTDGVTEAANAELDMFGDERLQAVLRAKAGESPAAILQAIRDELVAFTGRERHDDDVSLLVVKAR